MYKFILEILFYFRVLYKWAGDYGIWYWKRLVQKEIDSIELDSNDIKIIKIK